MKVIKKRLLWFSLCALMLVTILAAPSEPQPPPSQKIVLKYGSYAPRLGQDEPIIWWVNEVSKMSGEKIELEFYWAEALAKAVDCLGALRSGIYDIGWISAILTANKLPNVAAINSLNYTPYLYALCKASDETSTKYEPAVADWKANNVKFLFHTGLGNYQLLSVDPIKSVADIRGVKCRTFGYSGLFWSELGGVPVTMTMPEIYQALQTGALKAVLQNPSTFNAAKYFEVAKNFTYIWYGCGQLPVLMNLDKWNKLPPRVQNAMQKLAGEMPKRVYEMVTASELKGIGNLKAAGVKFNEMSQTDLARVREAAGIAIEKALADMARKKLPAKEVTAYFLPMLKKYEAEADKMGLKPEGW